MEDFFTSSLPPNHAPNTDIRNYSHSEVDAITNGNSGGGGGGGSRRSSHRHHSNSSGGNMAAYDRGVRLQGDNDYLRERVRSFEKGMGKIYQVCIVIVS